MSTVQLMQGSKMVSSELGIIANTIKLPWMSQDPRWYNYGIWPCNTLHLGGEFFSGRSGACHNNWENAVLATIGETIERYTPAFFPKNSGIYSSYKDLKKKAVHPSEYALFYKSQFEVLKERNYRLDPFDEEIEVTWIPTVDLVNNQETYCPAQFIYMPFSRDKNLITAGNSTGLAAHTNYHKAILNGLNECIERDSFVITWSNNIVPPKIKLSKEIQDYLYERFPKSYEWHLFDMTYDLGVPTVFGICMGENDFGKFVAVGSATRSTIGEAAKKVIQEIGQTSPYFRWLLDERRDWEPSDDYHELLSFADHSIFYLKRLDKWSVFDKWINSKEGLSIDFNEKETRSTVEIIREILKVFKLKNYNVLLKDLTTVDARQLGFYSLKIFIPQLIQMSGGYPFYFLGGKRLYEVPELMGYPKLDFDSLNKYPHPFP